MDFYGVIAVIAVIVVIVVIVVRRGCGLTLG